MASRLPTLIASLFYRYTPTQLHSHRCPFPEQGAGGQIAHGLYLWAASPQGPRHYPLTTPLWSFAGHEGLPAPHRLIGAEPSLECPECADPGHSVPHLFSCPPRPTDISVEDMWERPLVVAHFLLSVPSFSHLPEIPPPPPGPSLRVPEGY